MFKQNKDDNLIVSPISVKLLLTILAEAAGQDVDSATRNELLQVLPYNQTLDSARIYFDKNLASLQVRKVSTLEEVFLECSRSFVQLSELLISFDLCSICFRQ